MESRESGTGDATARVADAAFSGPASFERLMENLPAAFAVTRGTEHTLVYANAAFYRMTAAAGEPAPGRPFADAFAGRDTTALIAALDRSLRAGVIERDRRIEPADDAVPAWCCTVWPAMNRNGDPEYLVIELRVATEGDLALALQRDVTERMLLSALRERDVADGAAASSRRAAFLAAEGRRLAESLDEDATLAAIERMSLPYLGAWCIVDTIDEDGTMRRLAIIHPDPAKQARLRELGERWSPEPGDPFGAPAVLRRARPTVISDDVEAALAAAAHDAETLHVLRDIGVGPLLTVPLLIHERLVGAITFVAGQPGHAYTTEDVELAQDLAIRSAMALENSRMHGEARALKTKAESASQAKSTFLGTMSHELRTPLNAITGYVDLIDMGVRGPVTEAQRADLARIRSNTRHLTALVTDVLNFVRVDSGQALYDIADFVAQEVLAAAVELVGPLIMEKRLAFDGIPRDTAIIARGDPDRVTQILLNVLSNAIKFTPPGGRLAFGCEATEHRVLLRVTDTGIGIPADQLEAVFEPFIQLRGGVAGRDGGIGLGLSISRDLARAMGGDLIVESELGAGSTFTLSLPIATPEETSGDADR